MTHDALDGPNVGIGLRPIPTASHRAKAEPPVGFIISQEPFPGRIPFEFATQPGGDVAEVTENVRLHGVFDWAYCRGPALY